jgi:hypothetical protein
MSPVCWTGLGREDPAYEKFVTIANKIYEKDKKLAVLREVKGLTLDLKVSGFDRFKL